MKSINEIPPLHVITLILLIASRSTATNETKITWKIQSIGFNPSLCCSISGEWWLDNLAFRHKLSDLDKLITSVDTPLRNNTQFAVLEESYSQGDLVLLKSNRDTCGLTYLIRKKRLSSSVIAIYNTPPDSAGEKSLSWVFPIDTLGTLAKAYAYLTNEEYILTPESTTLSTKPPHKTDRKIVAGSLDSALSTITRGKREFAESLVRKDSISQSNFACSNREYFPFKRGCPIAETKPEIRDTTRYYDNPYPAKPMIYLYPESPTHYTVTLDSNIPVVLSYPKLNRRKWEIHADPGGKLVDTVTGKEYYGLFWEGGNWSHPSHDSGLVVKSSEFAERFDSLLVPKGLNYRERQEFVTYWMNRTLQYKWILIQFFDDQFTQSNTITISPTPPEFLRVYATFTGLDKYEDHPPQFITPRNRHKNAAIEWGGILLDGSYRHNSPKH